MPRPGSRVALRNDVAVIIDKYEWFLLTTRVALFFPYRNVPTAFLTIGLSVLDFDFRHMGFLVLAVLRRSLELPASLTEAFELWFSKHRGMAALAADEPTFWTRPEIIAQNTTRAANDLVSYFESLTHDSPAALKPMSRRLASLGSS